MTADEESDRPEPPLALLLLGVDELLAAESILVDELMDELYEDPFTKPLPFAVDADDDEDEGPSTPEIHYNRRIRIIRLSAHSVMSKWMTRRHESGGAHREN